MPHRATWLRLPLFLLLGCAGVAGLAPRAWAAADTLRTLPDSTWVDRWKLANGLDVTARHIPRCNSVAVIVAWRIGRDQDPKGFEGMADVLAEVLFTAAAGDVPERSREEMNDLRPSGWNLQITPRFTLISELAPTAQLPGMLAQVAKRTRGVTVTDSILARAKRTVIRDMGNRYFGSPELTLFNQLRDLGLGVNDEEMVRRTSGRSIKDVKAAEVRDRLRRLYVPANAVLSLAGDFEGIDHRALVRSLFEAIPGGVGIQEPPLPRLVPVARAMNRPGLKQPLGAVGIIAPALSDTLHPTFYLTSLLLGRYCDKAWGKAPDPLPARFRYPLFADPQIVQYFPPVFPGDIDPDKLGYRFLDAIDGLAGSIVEPITFEELRVNHAWLLGGQLTPPFRERIRQHPGTLHTLASSMAVRALWGDQAFWDLYLKRFMDSPLTEGERFLQYFRAMNQHIRLILLPAKP
ncbi:MAG TPA: insulinase family protein [Candidatus Eisenbacteria bacterium]|nr:insulinase family protein [Candidatus Eisenbacteria bacterium]